MAAFDREEQRGKRCRLAPLPGRVASQRRRQPYAANRELQGVLVDIVERDGGDRLAGSRDGVRYFVGHLAIRSHDERGRNVGVAAEADQLCGMSALIVTNLTAAIQGRECDRARNACRDARGGACNQAVEAQYQHVIAHAVTAIVTTIAGEGDGVAVGQLPLQWPAYDPVACLFCPMYALTC